MTMRVALVLHLEMTDEGEPVWWAESDDVPGFTAAADTLVELREQVVAALEAILGPVSIQERLSTP